MNFLEGTVRTGSGGRLLEWAGPAVPAPEWVPEGPALLGIRPEDLYPGNGSLSMAVHVVEDLGGDRFVYGETSGTPLVYRAEPTQSLPAPDERVSLAVRLGKEHWFVSGRRVEPAG
jgi:multiple sugar transport system ATP-binding protein